MILMQLNRIKRAKLIDEIIVTTSNHITDDELTIYASLTRFQYFEEI